MTVFVGDCQELPNDLRRTSIIDIALVIRQGFLACHHPDFRHLPSEIQSFLIPSRVARSANQNW